MPAPCANIASLLASGPLAVASIITHSGSAPRISGARMLVLPDGEITGSIGGGRCEAETIREAQDMMKRGENARCLRFSLNQAGDVDMICGGDIMVLLEQITSDQNDLGLFSAAALAEESDRPFVLIRLLDFPETDEPAVSGTVRRWLAPQGSGAADAGLPTALDPYIEEAWNAPSPLTRAASGQTWLLEPFRPPERIHIIGGGHVSLALARLAHDTGFSSTVLDDRREFLSRARFPHSKIVLPASLAEAELDKYFAAAMPGPREAVVIVTRGHAFDRDALAAALRTGAGYIGMIGSSAKRKQVYASLLKSGFTEQSLARVRSPIGLPIQAQTPEEIAVSIMAELIQWRRGGAK